MFAHFMILPDYSLLSVWCVYVYVYVRVRLCVQARVCVHCTLNHLVTMFQMQKNEDMQH